MSPAVVNSDTPCIRCGYSLRGLLPAMICPGCGFGVDQSIKAQPPRQPDEAKPCIRCGYSLHGLVPSMLCPECGLEVRRSLRSDRLKDSDPAYRRRLRLGALAVITPIGLALACLVALIAIGAAANRLVTTVDVLLPFVATALLAAHIAGWWWLTEPDPGQRRTDRSHRVRRATRATLTSFAVAHLINMSLAAIGRWYQIDSNVIFAAILLEGAIAGTSLVLGLHYLQWLINRIPHQKLRLTARSLAQGTIFFTPGQLAVSMIKRYTTPPSFGEKFFVPWTLLDSLVGLAMLGLVLGSCLFFSSLARELHRVAKLT